MTALAWRINGRYSVNMAGMRRVLAYGVTWQCVVDGGWREHAVAPELMAVSKPAGIQWWP